MASVIERVVGERVGRKTARGKISTTTAPAVKRAQVVKAEARKRRAKEKKTMNPRNVAGARRLLRDPAAFDRALEEGLR
jgi:hypothetical protein